MFIIFSWATETWAGSRQNCLGYHLSRASTYGIPSSICILLHLSCLLAAQVHPKSPSAHKPCPHYSPPTFKGKVRIHRRNFAELAALRNWWSDYLIKTIFAVWMSHMTFQRSYKFWKAFVKPLWEFFSILHIVRQGCHCVCVYVCVCVCVCVSGWYVRSKTYRSHIVTIQNTWVNRECLYRQSLNFSRFQIS